MGRFNAGDFHTESVGNILQLVWRSTFDDSEKIQHKYVISIIPYVIYSFITIRIFLLFL